MYYKYCGMISGNHFSHEFIPDNHLDFPFCPGSLYKSISVTGEEGNFKNIDEKVPLVLEHPFSSLSVVRSKG